MVSGCFVDLLTKQIVFHKYFEPQSTSGPKQHWWIDGWFGIEVSTNQGALFGMGQGKSAWFAALSIAALAGIIYWLFVRKAARDLWLTTALGAISGGILGNLYDRMGLWHGGSACKWNGIELPARNHYGVRDFIHFRWEGSPLKIFDPWPNFNIADSLLVCGAIALFVHALFARAPESIDDGVESKDKHQES